MADIAKRAGNDDGRAHRGRGADITKRAGRTDDGNGQRPRQRRRDHKDSARPPTAAVTLAPAAAKTPAAPAVVAKPAPVPKIPAVAAKPALAPKPTTSANEKNAQVAVATTACPDPGALDLGILFSNPAMFESRATWQAAGFTIIAGNHDSEILVASHPSARGVLFKKFTSKKSAGDQLRNYQLRVEGARKLRAFVAGKHLERIVVPQKWIHQLPGSMSHILVVEHVDVLPRSATQEAYSDIDERTLRDLCVVVRAFPGLDSGARNMLLTKDGKIAFIDTERWDEKRERSNREQSGLRHIRDYLTDKQRKRVKKIFQQLDEA